MKQDKSMTSIDILFFPVNEENSKGTRLKTFMSFLSGLGASASTRFSYTDSEGSLIPNLSIKENIYLDSIPCSLTETKEFQLNRFLDKTGNVHLLNLFSSIHLLDERPDAVDDQTRKIAALLKSMLQDSDYLLLDMPDKYLDDKSLYIFKKALEFHVANSGQTILVASKNQDLWASSITKVVYRNSDRSFSILPVQQELGPEDQAITTPVEDGHLVFIQDDASIKRAA